LAFPFSKKELSFDQAPPLKVRPYERLAQYYETDQMKIIHHANYVRWMEEARVDVMEQIGFGYATMEAMGVYSPVLGLSTQYKQMVRFNDRVIIECRIGEYNGLKLTMLYRMTNKATGEVCTYAQSQHCFMDGQGHIVSLKRSYPHVHQLLLDSMDIENQQPKENLS
jgi:acyl-CoA thioester hydrolase